MKNLFKLLTATAVLALAASCAEKEYPIVEQLDLPRCMKPVRVSAERNYDKADCKWLLYPDAVSYNVEFYNVEIPEEGEPDPANLVSSVSVEAKGDSEQLVHYIFQGEEDVTYYFRVQATNPAKDPSYWSEAGDFTTTADPEKVCTKPDSPVVTAIAKKLKLSWGVTANVKYYQFEVYSKSIPSTGEPAAADLVTSAQVDVTAIPATIEFTAPDGTYYFRVKGCDPEHGRRDSKWATGKFTKEPFNWPNDPNAITEGFTSQAPKNSPVMGALASGDKLPEDVVFEKITYAKDCSYYGDRVSLSGSWKAADAIYDGKLPKIRNVHFSVNVPGTFSFVPRCSSTGKNLSIAVITNKKDEGEKVTVIYDQEFAINVSPSSGGVPLSFEISEELLWGITEPAIIWIYSSNGGGMQVYPITWTPAAL